jgi:PEP-CTERM motif
MNDVQFGDIKQVVPRVATVGLCRCHRYSKKGPVMKKLMFAALIASASITTPAAAAVVIGTTVDGLTYNRALSGAPPSGLSGVGTAVRYKVTPFTVTANGSYTLALTATSAFDAFLGLHNNAFNPANALQNALAYDDDAGPGSDSLITINLMSGVSYFAIATGFANTDFGDYSLDISGAGDVVIGGAGAVPEPTTWAMIIAGFGIVGGALRRRRRTLAIA